jgi:hypothetical protein
MQIIFYDGGREIIGRYDLNGTLWLAQKDQFVNKFEVAVKITKSGDGPITHSIADNIGRPYGTEDFIEIVDPPGHVEAGELLVFAPGKFNWWWTLREGGRGV